jgi:integrase
LTVTAYNTGIRKGEVLKMGWDQCDFDGDVLLLYRGETKSGKPRTLRRYSLGSGCATSPASSGRRAA